MKRLTSLMLAVLMMVTVMLAVPALAEEKLTITLASFPDQPKAALQAAIDAANLDFNVEIVEYPQNEYENKIKMAYGAGKATDLVLMDGPNIASYAVTGVLEPLDTYWDKADYDDLVDSAKSTVSWNGQVWAAPLNESNTVLFYNKKIFDELGIVPPTEVEEAWTFEELLEVCEKVAIPGQRYAIQPQMFSLANKNEGQTFTEMLWLWMGGGEVIAPDGSTATGYFDSAESKAGIQFYADLFAKGYATTEDIINAFETDRVAMWINGPWCIGNWERDFPEVQWGVTPMPRGARSASGSGSWNIGMSASSEHKEEAWKVIEAITGKQGQAIWCNMTKNIPARASVMDADPTYAEYPFNIIRAQMLSNSMARPSTPAYPQISEALMDCFAEVAFGEDVNASVEKATQKMNEALSAVQ
ncbi:MAG: sugar ABC transporter substrate-binding protein [Candidatus Limiplasma sp.]|nr:sugar ABC transporter substrate-binding protein [Candidatus Limiplasma sp.]